MFETFSVKTLQLSLNFEVTSDSQRIQGNLLIFCFFFKIRPCLVQFCLLVCELGDHGALGSLLNSLLETV